MEQPSVFRARRKRARVSASADAAAYDDTDVNPENPNANIISAIGTGRLATMPELETMTMGEGQAALSPRGETPRENGAVGAVGAVGEHHDPCEEDEDQQVDEAQHAEQAAGEEQDTGLDAVHATHHFPLGPCSLECDGCAECEGGNVDACVATTLFLLASAYASVLLFSTLGI